MGQTVQNKGLIYKQVPSGWPVEGQDLVIEDRPFDLDTEPSEDGITIKTFYTSFDPYLRGRMRDPQIKSYSPPFEPGNPINSSAIAKVLKSRSSKFKSGDIVTGLFNTQEYSVVSADIAINMTRVINNPYNLDPKLFIGALGMPGLTAYAGLYDIGKPQKGETIFVSAASGAVGQIVGQLAKHEGLTVIGSVGSDDKLDFIKKDLQFDDGFNYKEEKPAAALKRLAPQGIDIYFENVGGETLDAAIVNMTDYGRIIACGMVSQYNAKSMDEVYGVKSLTQVVAKRLTIRGFIVGDPDMGPRYAKDHQKNVSKWISEGTFKAQESVTRGIDNAVNGFLGMLKGENFGKAVLEINKLEVREGESPKL